MNNNEVKECEHISKYGDLYCNLYKNCCINNRNCAHKQLLQLKAENKQLTQKLEKAREYLNAIVNGTHFTEDLSGHLIDLAQQALKELDT